MLFKRIKQDKNQKKDDNQLIKTNDISPITKQKERSQRKIIGKYLDLPIYYSNSFRTRMFYRKYFRGNELTIMSKPVIMNISPSFIRYNKANTILHEIRYIGDKSKTLKIRIGLSEKTYVEINLGFNQYKSLYICRNKYGNLVTYREKYEKEKSKPQYTKILKHYYCRETFKYLGEML